MGTIMLVKHINAGLFDIFFNQGWDNWARFEVVQGKVNQIKGHTVPTNIQSFLAKRYNK
jgi:hypothetical protein